MIRAALAARRATRQSIEIRRGVEETRARCQSLAEFVREAWSVLEPVTQYVHGKHIDLICAHLEAVTDGRINRLLINVPPGFSKSLLVSVFWPAWEWGPKGRRSLRYLATSYGDGPIERDGEKCRDLIASEWYQTNWPEVALKRKGIRNFTNTATGSRRGVPFGSLTSQRGDRLILDDPHSTQTAESEAERAKTTRKFREGAINRLNDQKKSAIVIIMQRLHEGDISGVIIAQKMGYVHLCLPIEFERDRRCVTSIGSDWRQVEGELLDPIRFPLEVVRQLEHDSDVYAFAGQYMQRPTPRQGGFFVPDSMPILEYRPQKNLITSWVRAWDLAGTKDGDWTCGVLMGKMTDGNFVVAHVERFRGTPDIVEKRIVSTAVLDKASIGRVMTSLPQDPGQAGKSQILYLTKALVGFPVTSSVETGDKATRAEPLASQINVGAVSMVAGDWNADYVGEFRVFPRGNYDDQIDASSRAFNHLLEMKGPMIVSDEVLAMSRIPTRHTPGRTRL